MIALIAPASPLGWLLRWLGLWPPARRHGGWAPRHRAPRGRRVLPGHLETDAEYAEARAYTGTLSPAVVDAASGAYVLLDDLLEPRPGEPHVLGEELLDLWAERQTTCDHTLIGASA